MDEIVFNNWISHIQILHAIAAIFVIYHQINLFDLSFELFGIYIFDKAF
jgi:hypothetical protein